MRRPGRQGKTEPGSDRTEQTASYHPDRVTDLAAGRSRQKLAEGNQIDKRLLSQPAPSFNEFLTEITKVRNRTAERGETEAEEDEKRLEVA